MTLFSYYTELLMGIFVQIHNVLWACLPYGLISFSFLDEKYKNPIAPGIVVSSDPLIRYNQCPLR